MWLNLAGLTSGWAAYYFCLCFVNRKCSAEWNCRIVALTHSVVVCRLVEYFIFLDSWPLYRIGGPNTYGEYIVLYFSASYFIFDLIWCLYMRFEGPVMLAHHMVCVIGIPSIMYFGTNGAESTFCTWGGELTNPFLQIRWFLRETNNDNSKLFWWNDCIFAIMFLVVRAGIFSVLAYCFYFAPCPLIMKVLGLVFYFIGLYWCVKIFGFIKRKLM